MDNNVTALLKDMEDPTAAMANIAALTAQAEIRKAGLAKTGLEPVYNEQTPAVSPVYAVTPDIIQLCDDLVYWAGNNSILQLAGLAANQVAKDGQRLTLRACVVRTVDNERNVRWIAAVNPEIIEKKGATTTSYEGCLTWPGKQVVATRHEDVKVRYMTLNGHVTEHEATGFEALVWQHEVNHLDGVPETFALAMSEKQKPNERCACGSGKKHKKCCGRF